MDERKGKGSSEWRRARKAETGYARQLRKIAKHIGEIVNGFGGDIEDPAAAEAVAATLDRYAGVIQQWAAAVGQSMVAEVNKRDLKTWNSVSREMGRLLRQEIETAPTGRAMREALDRQTELITSLPREAAQRVRDLTREGIIKGTRASEIAAEIMRSGEVSEARANLIARTEVSRTQVELTKARATSIGSTHFIWHTSHDSDVRPSHAKLDGKVFRWDDPPECDPGYRALPGGIFNCFTGDTVIGLGNGVRRIFRSKFAGKVVDIGGAYPVSATANHPMLTNRGWVPACEVHEGDYLVKPVNEAKLVVNADVDDPKPTFEQLFETFALAKAKHAAGVKFDFHGDRPDGDVEVISFDFPLSDKDMAKACKGVGNLILADADGGIVGPSDGRVDHIAQSLHSSGSDEIAALAVRHSPHPDSVGFRPGSSRNAGLGEDAADRGAINAEIDGKGEFAFAGRVFANDAGFIENLPVVSRPAAAGDNNAAGFKLTAQNVRVHSNRVGGVFQHGAAAYEFYRVTDIRVREFLGHVYTIETITGWYGVTSASTIVKNCRCWAEPVIPEDD